MIRRLVAAGLIGLALSLTAAPSIVASAISSVVQLVGQHLPDSVSTWSTGPAPHGSAGKLRQDKDPASTWST